MKRAAWILVGLLLVGTAVLVRLRFDLTHGALFVMVDDVTDREHPRPVTKVDLAFRDASGRELARASARDPAGTIFIVSPADTRVTKRKCSRPPRRRPARPGPLFRPSVAVAAAVDRRRDGRRFQVRRVHDSTAPHRHAQVSGYVVAVVGAAPAHRRSALHQLQRVDSRRSFTLPGGGHSLRSPPRTDSSPVRDSWNRSGSKRPCPGRSHRA